MTRLLLLTVITSCYLKQLPVTDDIARVSTYRIAVQMPDGTESRADAWAIDEHHLVTAGALCAAAENVALLAAGGVLPVLAHVDVAHHLCLLDAPPSLEIGPPLVLARAWHRHNRHLDAVGSPIWSRWGVVGVVLEADLGKVTSSASLAEIKTFALAQGVKPVTAPPLSDADMDISCQQGAKAMGYCSTFEPGSVTSPGDVGL